MNNKENQPTYKYTFLLPVGIGLGTALGALIHNVGVGMVIGVAIGTFASLLGETLSKRQGEQ